MTTFATTPATRPGLPLWPAAFAGCFCALLAVWTAFGLHEGAVETMVMGNDSGMRLLTLRDLIAGQGWFDATQPRLGPDGTEMHWSRLVDAPMLLLVLGLEPVMGRAGAEAALLLIWPLAMLAAVIATSAAIARRMSGSLAAGLAIGAGLLALFVRWRFLPGDIDHHNVQMLLLLLALWGWTARHDAGAAAPGAGLAIAASLCVGVETLPLLVAIGLAFAGIWATRGPSETAPALGFSAGLGIGLAGLFAATAPTIAWTGGFCDAVSVDLVAPVLAGAALLFGLAGTLSSRSAATRTVCLVAGGAILAAAVVTLRPTCLANPYDALDPFIVEHWLDYTAEAEGLIAKVSAGELSYLVIACFALVTVAALPLVTGRQGLLLAGMLALALAISAYQIRGMLSVVVLTLLGLSVVAGTLRRRSLDRPGIPTQLTAVVALLTLAVASAFMGLGKLSFDADRRGDTATAELPQCSDEGSWEILASLPAGLVASASDLGVPILLATPHRVLAAPYHRNQAGLKAAFSILLAPTDAEAEALMRASGADYLVICPADGDVDRLARNNGDIFGKRITDGAIPAFLAPVPGTQDAAARIFALAPQS